MIADAYELVAAVVLLIGVALILLPSALRRRRSTTPVEPVSRRGMAAYRDEDGEQ